MVFHELQKLWPLFPTGLRFKGSGGSGLTVDGPEAKQRTPVHRPRTVFERRLLDGLIDDRDIIDSGRRLAGEKVDCKSNVEEKQGCHRPKGNSQNLPGQGAIAPL